MTDVFVSYASVDSAFAESAAEELRKHGLSVFLASISIQPGTNWSDAIQSNLQNSKWVLVLASRAACQSAFVQQEIGGAIFSGKKLNPVVWDMPPEELPGWLKQYQALDLRATLEGLSATAANIAAQIRAEKQQALVILGCIALAFVLFSGEGAGAA